MSADVFYNIEKIIDKRITNGQFEYKIKWEGYPMSQCTWEPFKNLETAKEMVDEYNLTHPVITQMSSKPGRKKNSHFINKKRKKEKDENDDMIKEISQNGNNNVNIIKINDDEQKPSINNNLNQKKYIVDESLKSVHTVKQENEKLIAIVDKIDEEGNNSKVYISTGDLKVSNPWILLDFYESKIKFT